MNQWQLILKYLEENGSITPMDAQREFGCMRLGARILDLRRRGYQIITEMEVGKNRFGHCVQYARYQLLR